MGRVVLLLGLAILLMEVVKIGSQPVSPIQNMPLLSVEIPARGQVEIDTTRFPDGPIWFTVADPITGEISSSGTFNVHNQVDATPLANESTK